MVLQSRISLYRRIGTSYESIVHKYELRNSHMQFCLLVTSHLLDQASSLAHFKQRLAVVHTLHCQLCSNVLA